MVGGVFRLLAKLFPFQPTAAQRRRYEDLARSYRAVSVAELVPALVLSSAAAYGWYRALVPLWEWRAARLPPSRFLLGPSPWLFALCALVLGILSAAPALRLFLRAVLRERLDDYVLFTNLRVGFDTWKALGGLAALIAAPVLAVALLSVDAYARVTDDGLALNPLLGLAERHRPFSDVDAVRLASHFRAPSGDVVERPHVVILFRDGTRWSSRAWWRDPDPARDRALGEFVAARAGRPVEAVALGE